MFAFVAHGVSRSNTEPAKCEQPCEDEGRPSPLLLSPLLQLPPPERIDGDWLRLELRWMRLLLPLRRLELPDKADGIAVVLALVLGDGGGVGGPREVSLEARMPFCPFCWLWFWICDW